MNTNYIKRVKQYNRGRLIYFENAGMVFKIDMTCSRYASSTTLQNVYREEKLG
jgi:hypothetical protein